MAKNKNKPRLVDLSHDELLEAYRSLRDKNKARIEDLENQIEDLENQIAHLVAEANAIANSREEKANEEIFSELTVSSENTELTEIVRAFVKYVDSNTQVMASIVDTNFQLANAIDKATGGQISSRKFTDALTPSAPTLEDIDEVIVDNDAYIEYVDQEGNIKHWDKIEKVIVVISKESAVLSEFTASDHDSLVTNTDGNYEETQNSDGTTEYKTDDHVVLTDENGNVLAEYEADASAPVFVSAAGTIMNAEDTAEDIIRNVMDDADVTVENNDDDFEENDENGFEALFEMVETPVREAIAEFIDYDTNIVNAWKQGSLTRELALRTILGTLYESDPNIITQVMESPTITEKLYAIMGLTDSPLLT